MKATHLYFLNRVEALQSSSCAWSTLDFGCGHGEVVQEGVRRGLDMFGCEYAGPGGHLDIPEHISEAGLADRVRLTDGKVIPFDDGAFDLVISNQVFEHIPNFNENLREIGRVLGGGGTFINFFPHKGTVFEVHCRAPMPHWFGSNVVRAPLLLAGKLSGLGRRKKERNPSRWVRFWLSWLEGNTFYRSKRDVLRSYRDEGFQDVEIDTLGYVLARHRGSTWALIRFMPFSERLAQRFFGLMIVARKGPRD